ncbi:hypothetical protein NPIL_574141, partial [Nephila pilipes]
EASGSFSSNVCQAKNEHRRYLAVAGTRREKAKLQSGVAKSRVTAFVASAAH